MSNETTAAVERAVEALRDRSDAYDPDELVAVAVVRSALDIESIAPILRQVATGNGGWTYLTERTKRKWREAAQEFRTALLGGAS